MITRLDLQVTIFVSHNDGCHRSPKKGATCHKRRLLQVRRNGTTNNTNSRATRNDSFKPPVRTRGVSHITEDGCHKLLIILKAWLSHVYGALIDKNCPAFTLVLVSVFVNTAPPPLPSRVCVRACVCVCVCAHA